MKTNFLAILSIFWFSGMLAQTAEEKAQILAATNVAELNRLAPIYDSIFKAQKQEALNMAAANGWKIRYAKENGGVAELIRLDENNNPVYFSTDNAGAAITTRANRLNSGGSLGLSLDGQNMTIGVWDGGKVRNTHNLLTPRVTQVDNATALSAHATHVSGTMMGNGTASSSAKGMAPMAALRAYDWNSDVSEVTTAAANGLLVSNHSYGYDPDSVPLIKWGRYDSDSRSFDNVMFNAPYYQFVNSAGNSRNGGYNDEKQGYDLLAGKSCSKNGIIVAAVNQVTNYTGPNSVVMSGFSSWGPTDDGRIKPDICGKGVNVRSSVSSSDNAYSSFSGTSMSSPNVAGTLLLLQQHYKNVKGGFMRAATLRGLALHTADEAGTDPGPDYRFGWGLMNAERAAVLINNEGTQSYIQENVLQQGKSFSLDVQALGNQPLVASICWTDPAGQIILGSTVDLPTPNLVNDLDIRITKNGETYFPWKLNPADVEAAATKGDNLVDNIEKIEVGNASGTYTVTVSHKGNLTNNLQNYSLIISGITARPMLLTSDTTLINRNCVGTGETVFTYQLQTPNNFSENAAFEIEGLPAGATATFEPATMSASGSGTVTITGLSGTAAGNFPLLLKANSTSYNASLSLNLVVQSNLSEAPVLLSPVNNTNPIDTLLTLEWAAVGTNVTNYTIELSKDETFSTNVTTYINTSNQLDLSNLDYGSNYYWRVKANNICGSSAYSQAYRFTTQCSNANVITISGITTDSATATWANPNGSSSFDIQIVPQGTAPGTVFQTVNTNSYTFTGLDSYSNYVVYVKASCSNNVFSALSDASFSTLINYCVDGVFFDNGGPDQNYPNGQYYNITMSPINPNEKVSVTFNTFSLENEIDRLTIYNGPNTTYPYIVEQYGFTGTNNPGTVTSTDASGALTFVFYSDGANNAPGWTASVNCATLSSTAFDRDSFVFYPNPTRDKITFIGKENILKIEVMNILGQLIREEKPNSTQSLVDLSNLPEGQYICKITTDRSTSAVKVLKRN